MKKLGLAIRAGRKGDVVVIAGHRVGERERIGEILEVLGGDDHVHYRVRWEDGNESVFYPGSDATIRRAQRRRARAKAAPSSAVTTILDARSVAYEVISHPRTMTAKAEASAVGVEPGKVAKTLVLTSGDGFVRAVLPASQRIDLGKVRSALDQDVTLASETALAGAYPEFELGAVPPIGGTNGDPVLVDRRLQHAGRIVLEAGTHERSLRMDADDLISVAEARVIDMCEE